MFQRVSDFLVTTSLENANCWSEPEIRNSNMTWRNIYVFNRVSSFLVTTSLKHVNCWSGPEISNQKMTRRKLPNLGHKGSDSPCVAPFGGSAIFRDCLHRGTKTRVAVKDLREILSFSLQFKSFNRKPNFWKGFKHRAHILTLKMKWFTKDFRSK